MSNSPTACQAFVQKRPASASIVGTALTGRILMGAIVVFSAASKLASPAGRSATSRPWAFRWRRSGLLARLLWRSLAALLCLPVIALGWWLKALLPSPSSGTRLSQQSR